MLYVRLYKDKRILTQKDYETLIKLKREEVRCKQILPENKKTFEDDDLLIDQISSDITELFDKLMICKNTFDKVHSACVTVASEEVIYNELNMSKKEAINKLSKQKHIIFGCVIVNEGYKIVAVKLPTNPDFVLI